MSSKRFVLTLAVLPGLLFCAACSNRESTVQPEPRYVEDNVLHSSINPALSVTVADGFSFAGSFDFVLKDIVEGERFVFVDTGGTKIERLFIAQFENFLPDNEHTYNYDFTNAEAIGRHRYRQNTWAYSNSAARANNPEGEGSLTASFLESKGYLLEDELMMSRFVMVPDSARRHEMILFYLENASTTGYSIDTFYDADDSPTEHWRSISEGLTTRSREAFSIRDHRQ